MFYFLFFWWLPGIYSTYKMMEYEDFTIGHFLTCLLLGVLGWISVIAYLEYKYDFLYWKLWRRK